MVCPVCGTENPEGAKMCQCGFYFDLIHEADAPAKKERQVKKASEKVKRKFIFGIVWLLVGVGIIAFFYFIPQIHAELKARFMTVGFFVVIYGIFELYSFGRVSKISKIVVEEPDKKP